MYSIDIFSFGIDAKEFYDSSHSVDGYSAMLAGEGKKKMVMRRVQIRYAFLPMDI